MTHAVKDVMNRHVLTVDVKATAADAARIMADDDAAEGYVLVLERGTPVGIVTQVDLVNKVLATGVTRRTKVSQIMSTPLTTIDPDADLLNAADVMREANLRKLPVVKDGIVYGVLTSKDLVQTVTNLVDAYTREIVQYTPFNLRF